MVFKLTDCSGSLSGLPLISVRLLLFASVVSAIACSSPLAPGECRNGRDSSGRGPLVTLRGNCVAEGADLQCEAVRVEQSYCAGPQRDVTAVARWISTDESVVTFTTPGYAKTVGSGEATIYAEFDTLYTLRSFSYRFRPGARPEQVSSVDVSVWQDTRTSGVLPGAAVEFTPQMGSRQVCHIKDAPPWTPCRFWSDIGSGLVRASKDGYVPVETTIVVPSKPDPSYPVGAVLKLRPR